MGIYIVSEYVLSRGAIESLKDVKDMEDVYEYGPEDWLAKSVPGAW